MRARGSNEGERTPSRHESLRLAGILTLTVGLASTAPNLLFWALFASFTFRIDDSNGGTGGGDEGANWVLMLLVFSGPALVYGLVLGLLTSVAALGALRWAERHRTLPAWGAVVVGTTAASLTIALVSAVPVVIAESEELRVLLDFYSSVIGVSGWFYPLPLLAGAVAASATIAHFRLRRTDAASAAVDASQSVDPTLNEPRLAAEPTLSAAPPGEGPDSKRTGRRVALSARVALALGALGMISPLWMSGLNGGFFAPHYILDEARYPTILVQAGLALIAPLAAIVLAVLVLFRGTGRPHSSARQTSESSAAMAAAALVVSACVLAATIGMGAQRLAEVRQSIENRDRIAAMPVPDPATPEPGATPAPTEPAPAPTLEPEVASAAMTPDEARLAMDQLIATSVAAVTGSRAAPGGELRWLDASVADTSTGNDAYSVVPAPTVAVEESCLEGAGVRFSMPPSTFALGLITDASSDDSDSEVIDANVEASDRLVAAWEQLGYGEGDALGGNIVMAGPPDAAAADLGIRFNFGTATMSADGLCVVDTR